MTERNTSNGSRNGVGRGMLPDTRFVPPGTADILINPSFSPLTPEERERVLTHLARFRQEKPVVKKYKPFTFIPQDMEIAPEAPIVPIEPTLVIYQTNLHNEEKHEIKDDSKPTPGEQAFLRGYVLGKMQISDRQVGIVVESASKDEERKRIIAEVFGAFGKAEVRQDKEASVRTTLPHPEFDFITESPDLNYFETRESFLPFLLAVMRTKLSPRELRISLSNNLLYRLDTGTQKHLNRKLGGRILLDQNAPYIAIHNPQELERMLEEAPEVRSLRFFDKLFPQA